MSDRLTASRPARALPAAAPVFAGRSPRWKRATAALLSAAVLSSQFHTAAFAQGQKLNVIRDAEIEELLRDYTKPILRAAGLARQNIEVVIIGDRGFNAFVADGRRIFVNVGALYESVTPNQIIGVLAHETGHIAGGHLSRLREQLAGAQTAAIIALLLGAAAIGAGAAAGGRGSDIGQAAPGVLLGPQEVIRRTLLTYQRGQEEAADRAAVGFLNATGQSSKGMIETFERFAQQTLFISQQIDPYLLSHPMPQNRVANLQAIAQQSPHYNKKDPAELLVRHEMMRAKLSGFVDKPDAVFRRYPSSNNSLPAQYARAISAYRWGNLRSALAQIDALIALQPRNPYFHELKGQALLESGRARDAIAPLRQAVSLSDGAPLIRMLFGQALVQSNNVADAQEAIRELRFALQKEPNAPLGHRQLAIAYGRSGDRANADLSSATASFNEGDFRTAKLLATRAQGTFPTGSPGWLKADDIIKFQPPKLSN